MSWKEPKACPICGGDITKPDPRGLKDPELVVCDEHGLLEVHIIKKGEAE